MKERPILFSAPMVNAILDGRKTQTRRVVKNLDYIQDWDKNDPTYGPFFEDEYGDSHKTVEACPYWQPSDRLWVRETWADVNTPDGPAICYRADSSYQHWKDFSTTFGPDYGAGPSMDYDAYPGDYCMWWEDLLNRDVHKEDGYRWRPSIFMPRWASRLDLEIKDIRVERLQNMNGEDAISEGVGHGFQINAGWPNYQSIGSSGICEHTEDCPVMSFASLWDSINAKKHP